MEHESFLKKSLKRLDELLEGKTWDVERISSLSAHLNNVRGKIMVIPSHGYNHRNSHRNNRYGHTTTTAMATETTHAAMTCSPSLRRDRPTSRS